MQPTCTHFIIKFQGNEYRTVGLLPNLVCSESIRNAGYTRAQPNQIGSLFSVQYRTSSAPIQYSYQVNTAILSVHIQLI